MDYLVDVASIDSGVNSVNCTGRETALSECERVYENSTVGGCNRRATALCHEESKFDSHANSITSYKYLIISHQNFTETIIV